jgi:ketosteroid isomerase-like protein
MKKILLLSIIIFSFTNIFAQKSDLQKVYDTEKMFEKAAAEKGTNQAFIEFLAPDGIVFVPNATNGREFWKNRPKSAAALFWNPTFVDVSSNGVLAYTTGNSIFKPKGKDDPNAFYGEYATVWQRQPGGNYLAAVDLGISHEQPNNETKWTSPIDSGKELNEKRFSAADASTAFFETAASQGLSKAYKAFLADDARLLREGKMPIVGKQNALNEYKNYKSNVNFAKRSFFVGSADMAYISNSYTVTDKNNKQIETGNFLQVWKLRGTKWQIVFDAFVPIPPEKK